MRVGNEDAENWVFLGDSLTEGVGSSRINYVTEFVKLLREKRSSPVDEVRLRRVDPERFNPFLRVNLAGYFDHDDSVGQGKRLWLWNLASEGTTVVSDMQWLPFIDNLQPTRVFILRGALESILRPEAVSENNGPMWLPRSWRGYAAMDPMCYYSSTPWRKVKQVFVDELKQQIRLTLLKHKPGKPLMSPVQFLKDFECLVRQLKSRTEKIHVVGLPPIGRTLFPGSRQVFIALNEMLQNVAATLNLDFICCMDAYELQAESKKLFYLDEFHPNQAGACFLAHVLHAHLTALDISE